MNTISKTRHEIGQYSSALRDARKRLGLSQRELAERVGASQAHISRIEKGAVDMQLTTLLDFARSLDLELMVVPRKQVRSVEAILEASGGGRPVWDREWAQRMARAVRRVRDQLEKNQLHNQDRDLARQALGDLWEILPLVPHRLQSEVQNLISELGDKDVQTEQFRQIVNSLRSVRNEVVHREPAETRKAYRIDEEG